MLHGLCRYLLFPGTLNGTLCRPMSPKKRLIPVPAPNVRRHGDGYRGVVVILGTRHYGPTFATVDEASEWVRTKQRTGNSTSEPVTLAEGLQLLKADLADSGAAEGTLQFYQRAHLELCMVLGEAVELNRLDGNAIRHYLDKRRAAGVALKTILQKELGTLRRIVRLAMACGRLGRDPFAGVKLPRARGGRYEVIDAATVEAAIEKIRAENCDHADIVELIWRTSMRRAEVARLTVADVDLEARRLFVRGKNVDRYRPIGDALVPVLRRLMAAAGSNGRLVSSARKIEGLFSRWGKTLGIEAFSPHVLRHGFATDLLTRGVPAPVVASLMGHAGLRMLDRYYHANDSALRDAVESLGKGRPRRSLAPRPDTGRDAQEPSA